MSYYSTTLYVKPWVDFYLKKIKINTTHTQLYWLVELVQDAHVSKLLHRIFLHFPEPCFAV